MNRKKLVNKLLIVFVIMMAVTGFLIRPMGEAMWMIGLHKLSAVMFCVLCVMHGLQYRKRKGKQYVS